MSKELKSCKFCDEEDRIKVMESGVCWVECESCKCRGPVEVFESDAIDSWNKSVK